MPATQRGIYHNLRESKYVVSNSEITFFFSSDLYKRKFLDGYHTNRTRFKERITRVTGETPLNLDTLADVTFYEEIEKRGFFVRMGRAKISYNDLYKYALRCMNNRESYEWREGYGK